jgi:hypothetical protein
MMMMMMMMMMILFSEDNQKYLIPLILPETYVPFVPSSSENGQEKTTQQAINRTLS